MWDLFPDGRRLGGAPANVACHLAALAGPGSRVALVSRVGADDLGREAAAALQRRGVDPSLIQIDRERPTGRVEVTLCGGEPRYRLVEGCAWEHIEVTSEVARALGSARAFAYGTLSQRRSRAELERALALLPATCRTVCDVNLRAGCSIDQELLRACLAAADVVKLNQEEARMIERQLGVADACEWLLADLGAELVALTRGAGGCRLVTRAGAAEHPGVLARPGGDNVGAGDAFVAALIWLLAEGWPLPEICARANRYGAYVASCRGATPEVPAEVVRAVAGEAATGSAPPWRQPGDDRV